MALMFELSGQHPDLPTQEVLGALEAEGASPEVVAQADGIVVVRGKGVKPALAPVLASRLALTRKVSEFLFSCRPEEVVKQGKDIEVTGRTFCVRARRIFGSVPNTVIRATERELGGNIQERTKVKVDLERPKEVISVLFSDKAYIGRVLAEVDEDFEARTPSKRPFFSPISLHPKLARALVNLSRAPSKGYLLDPFCGTGGILIEGALMGINVVGGDLYSKMAWYTKKNLEHFGFKRTPIFQGDVGDIATWLKDQRDTKGKRIRVTAAAMDPPYGRATRTFGDPVGKIYRRAFEAMGTILAPGRYMSILLPSPHYLEGDLHEPFELCGRYPYKVHRSLTRHFCVLRRKR
jgi:tRNA (guanine10-N2)-dimethyltransferase